MPSKVNVVSFVWLCTCLLFIISANASKSPGAIEPDCASDIDMFTDNSPRARIGMIVIEEDDIGEPFMSLIFREIPNISYFVSRVRNEQITAADYLKYTAPDLPLAAGRLLPNVTLSCLSFICTSASFVIGRERTIELMRSGRAETAPSLHYTHATNSIIASLHAMQIKTMILLTPYVESVNQVEKEVFEDAGFDIVYVDGLNVSTHPEMAAISHEYIKWWTLHVVHHKLTERQRNELDAVFLSCGGWHAYKVVQELEDELQIPVVTTLTSSAWHMLRLSGIEDRITGYGALLSGY